MKVREPLTLTPKNDACGPAMRGCNGYPPLRSINICLHQLWSAACHALNFLMGASKESAPSTFSLLAGSQHSFILDFVQSSMALTLTDPSAFKPCAKPNLGDSPILPGRVAPSATLSFCGGLRGLELAHVAL